MVAGEGLRAQQTLRTQLNPAIFIEEKMNISLVSSYHIHILYKVQLSVNGDIPTTLYFNPFFSTLGKNFG